jgi:hypothetical protein
MNRMFSIIRRKPGLVDMVIPLQGGGVDSYELKAAANFDGVYAVIITCDNHGYMDPAVAYTNVHVPQAGNHARVIFSPASFSLVDTAPIWLVLTPYIGAVAQPPSGRLLMLPKANETVSIAIAGTAPNAATIAGSWQLDLPRLCDDLRVHNQDSSSKDLLLAFDPAGPEVAVSPSPLMQQVAIYGTNPLIMVRGDGATVKFSATLTFVVSR